MLNPLNPTIAAYLDASNARDNDTLIDCFAPDAVVEDEGQTYRGRDEISRWLTTTQTAYDPKFRALDAAEEGSESIVKCRVAGNFPGSPADLHFCFTLQDDRIAALTIRG